MNVTQSHSTVTGRPADTGNSVATPTTLDFGLLKFRSTQAQQVWSIVQSRDKRQFLERFRQRFVEQADELVVLVAAHRNCSRAEAFATEMIPLADAAKYLAKNFTRLLAPKRLGKKDRPSWLMGVDGDVHRQPLGLILIVSPGNYPLYLSGVQALQALIAGNAVWLKPAPGTTAINREFRELLVAAGLNADLFQILPESVEAVEASIRTGVDKVVFTGSANTGRKILSQLAPQLTPAVMELSGCDAVFLRADADLELAAQAVRFGLTLNNGHTCIAPKRIFVPRQLLGRFTQILRNELAIADPIRLDADTCRAWLPWVQEALDQGAFVVSGTLHGNRVDAPLVLSGTRPEMRLLRDDTFAPVASISVVDSDDEALAADELCPFALGASVFGRNTRNARDLAQRIKAGSVVINDLIAPTADPRLPFGGVGQSGFGVTRGDEGLLELTAPKVVITNRARQRMHHRPMTDADTPLFRDLLRMSHGSSVVKRIKALLSAISHFRTPANTSTSSQS